VKPGDLSFVALISGQGMIIFLVKIGGIKE
jgi:hypothetical protein